jgi:hypothetical protein
VFPGQLAGKSWDEKWGFRFRLPTQRYWQAGAPPAPPGVVSRVPYSIFAFYSPFCKGEAQRNPGVFCCKLLYLQRKKSPAE